MTAWPRVAPCDTHHVDAGEPAYAERFDAVLKFHPPGLAPVTRSGQAWHIHPDGRPAYRARFRRTFGFYEGRAAVTAADGWHHIGADGEATYDERYSWCGNFQGGRCAVRALDGRYRHITADGRPAYRTWWRYAGDFRDGVGVVQGEDGLSTHITADGQPMHGRWFVDLDVFHKGFARARDDGGWLHVDGAGRPIYPRRFAMVEPFYNGQARVEGFDGRLEIIDEGGATRHTLRGARDPSAAPAPPPSLLATLDAAPGPRVVLVRHADRHPIAAGEDGFEIPLTTIGRARARALGEQLAPRPRWAASSPLARCMQTAESLGLTARPSDLLGAPGPFVIDPARGGQIFARYGTQAVVRGFIAGETWGCMRPLAEGARMLVDHLRGALAAEGADGVAISHDAIVMPVIAWLTGHRFEDDWLAPLDGIAIGPTHAVWRGRQFAIEQ